MDAGRDSWALEESKFHFSLQEGQEGEPVKQLVAQPHLRPLEGDGPWNPFLRQKSGR